MKAVALEQTTGPSRAFLRLAVASASELERELVRGRTPAPDTLAGWEFRGLNHRRQSRWVGIRKFIKGFYRSAGGLYGYNVVVAQNADTAEWIAVPSEDSPKRHGFYRVREPDPSERDNAHLHALLLDYGQGENPRFDVTRGLRDYLVQVDDDVFLGEAYYAIGSHRLLLPSMFLLDRFRHGVSETP